jgi:hypothetical protein
MADDFDKAVEILNTATPSELADMVMNGAIAAWRKAEADLRQGKPGAKKAVRKERTHLLELFTGAALKGETPHQKLIEFVADQYEQVMYGGDARDLFPYHPYKPNDPKEQRGVQLAMEVELLRRKDRERLTLERAITEVADQHPGLGEDNLRKIHREYRCSGYFMAHRDKRQRA